MLETTGPNGSNPVVLGLLHIELDMTNSDMILINVKNPKNL